MSLTADSVFFNTPRIKGTDENRSGSCACKQLDARVTCLARVRYPYKRHGYRNAGQQNRRPEDEVLDNIVDRAIMKNAHLFSNFLVLDPVYVLFKRRLPRLA